MSADADHRTFRLSPRALEAMAYLKETKQQDPAQAIEAQLVSMETYILACEQAGARPQMGPGPEAGTEPVTVALSARAIAAYQTFLRAEGAMPDGWVNGCLEEVLAIRDQDARNAAWQAEHGG